MPTSVLGGITDSTKYYQLMNAGFADEQKIGGKSKSFSSTMNSSSQPNNVRSGSGTQLSTNGNGVNGHSTSNNSYMYDNHHEQTSPSDGLDFSGGVEESPFVDYNDLEFDLDDNFEFNPHEDGQMIGGLPEELLLEGDSDLHEKRKSPGDDSEDGNDKKRGSEDKSAKKPGRKPLTSEPTSKRKAQNRAAQRAFRERKEKHLKDLETKVTELEKASESANHENALLRAQVERLATELREYRKRLSGSAVGRSTAGTGLPSYIANRANVGPGNLNFQFDFPKFGQLPGSTIFNNTAITRKSSDGHSPGSSGKPSPADTNMSPKTFGSQKSTPPASTTANGTAPKPAVNGAGAPKNAATNDFGGLFSPGSGFMQSFGSSPNGDYSSNQHTPGQNGSRNNLPNGNMNYSTSTGSVSASPSVSSVSHNGPNSSCATSPESSNNSPSKPGDNGLNPITEEGMVCHGHSDAEISFCENLNMACGNHKNPVPRAMSVSSPSMTNAGLGGVKSPKSEVNGFNWLAEQNGGSFDPVLFGEYREPQENILSSNDFGGFFTDAFPLPDFGSPLNFDAQAAAAAAAAPMPKQHDLIQQVEQNQNADEDEEVVPGEDPTKMLNCNKIWDRLQNMPEFQNGELDVESLCTELRTKARCSETGVVIDQKDVDHLLARKNHVGI